MKHDTRRRDLLITIAVMVLAVAFFGAVAAARLAACKLQMRFPTAGVAVCR